MRITNGPRLLSVAPTVRGAWGEWPAPPTWAAARVARVAELAARRGLTPQQLAGGQAFADLAETQGWAPETIRVTAHALRAAGIDVTPGERGRPAPSPTDLTALWRDPGEAPTLPWLRAAAWARLAWGWPAPLPRWRQLTVADVAVTADDIILCADRPWRRLPGAAGPWRAWLDARERHPILADADAALPTLRNGPASRTGDPLSLRGLEAAFAAHAAAAAAAHGRPDLAALRYATLVRLARERQRARGRG